MKFAWKFLVVVGLVLVFAALGADTTVQTGYGRVHNTGMQAQQLLLLILGCVLFLAGIGLFGVLKVKQTAEEERREREQALAAAKEVGEAVSRNVETAGLAAASVIQQLKPGTDRWGWRLLVAVLLGTYLGILGDFFGVGAVVFLGSFAACWWGGRPARAVLQRAMLVAGVAGIVLVAVIVVFNPSSVADQVDDSKVLTALLASVVPAVGFLLAAALLRPKTARAHPMKPTGAETNEVV